MREPRAERAVGAVRIFRAHPHRALPRGHLGSLGSAPLGIHGRAALGHSASQASGLFRLKLRIGIR
jgi:hypothetical protein